MARWREITESYKYVRLLPRLKIQVRNQPLKFENAEGPMGRLKTMRKTVTALFKHERIELNFSRASEARGYAERLITDAMRFGDCHRPTMEMADFWIEEKQIIHKLFKVLVPRYMDYNKSYTRMFTIPCVTEGPFPNRRLRSILELKGNPYPSVVPVKIPTYYQIQNILLHEAKREFRSANPDHNPFDLVPNRPEDPSVPEVVEKFNKLNTEDR